MLKMDDAQSMTCTAAVADDASITFSNFPVKLNKLLKDSIYNIFISFIIAENIVNVFKKYSPKVLVDKDIEIVKRKAEYKGNIEANEELLNRLVTYEDWFPCLLQCLRDKQVNQGHIALKMEEIGDFVNSELQREVENQKFQYPSASVSSVSVKSCSVSDLDEKEKGQMLEKYHSLLFESTEDVLNLTPCQVEHLLGSLVLKLSSPGADNDTLKAVMQLLTIVKLYIHNTHSFEEVIIRLELPGKLVPLCFMPVEPDLSTNSKRQVMKIKQSSFEVLTHLMFSTALISHELIEKDLLNAIQNVLDSPEFQLDKETDKEIQISRAEMKRDIVLILSSVVRNIDLKENCLLIAKFEKILKQTLVDQDKLVHDLSLFLSAYVQYDFMPFLKENNINIDDMLQSLLSHLRFYAIYNVLNSKVEIQTLAYFEGFAKLATIKQIKRKMKQMTVLRKLYFITKELGGSKCHAVFVRILTILGTFQAEDKINEAKDTEYFSRPQLPNLYYSCLEEKDLEEILSRNAKEIESYLKALCEKLMNWSYVQEQQVVNDLVLLLKIIQKIQTRLDEFHPILVSSKLSATLEQICLHFFTSKETLFTALKVYLILVEMSSLFSQTLATRKFFFILILIMEDIERKSLIDRLFLEKTQNIASLIMLTIVSKSKEKCIVLEQPDVVKQLTKSVRSSNYMVLVIARVLVLSHEEHEDAVKFLIHWLKEAMSNQQCMAMNGLSAKLILYCLSQLSNNSSNRLLIKDNSYIKSLHQEFHPETDPSLSLSYIILLKKLGVFDNATKEVPSLKEEAGNTEDTTDDQTECKNIDNGCSLDEKNIDEEEKTSAFVSFGEYELSRKNVIIKDLLISNTTSQIWKGKMNGSIDVAVKILNSETMSKDEFLIEAKILSKIKNKHNIQFLGVVLEKPLYIVTEFIPNGTLLNVLKSDSGKSIKLDNMLKMNRQVCEGMNYLECHKIVHRDLRAENVLVGNNYKVIITGFGNATTIDNESNQISRKDFSYKIKWTAPEAATNKQFSSKSDVWSFGILMYEIVTFGSEPYDKMSDSDVLQMIQDGRRLLKPKNERLEIPHSYYNSMMSCWRKLPEERPNFECLLNKVIK
ncbi:tyrosine-protein kinase FRK [Biomphalaria glabrata]|nr:tyrosine-protein kinase FRK [Biomphalaria glabrata]